MYSYKFKWLLVGLWVLLLVACVADPRSDKSKNAWTTKELLSALANSSRPQLDRDRDADRKPAQLMTFFGVERGITVVDIMASGGFVTEVLSVTTGPTGKVYAQNVVPVPDIFDKALSARLADNRLPNVVRVDGALTSVPAKSIDFEITVMNLHDIYNSAGPQRTSAALKSVYDQLKPNGVFGVVDHVGVSGADNAKLHRMTKQQAVDVVVAAGFVLEAESNVLARPSDDHTKRVFDPSVRGKTDQFILKFRKPK